MSPIDRTKHDEDIAERMVGGARMDRTIRPQTREPEAGNEDRPAKDRHRSRDRGSSH